MLRPAGILVPDRRVDRPRQAGFGQIEAQVIKVGMIGEVTCMAIPFTVIPVVVTEVQSVDRRRPDPADRPAASTSQASPGPARSPPIMEPLFPGELDRLPPGSDCIANAYTSNHDALQDPRDRRRSTPSCCTPSTRSGLVHAMILRLQALLLPVRTLVLGGGH